MGALAWGAQNSIAEALIAEKCGVAEDSFELEYPDADFDEYVRLDEDGFKHVRDMIKLKIIERKSKRQQR